MVRHYAFRNNVGWGLCGLLDGVKYNISTRHPSGKRGEISVTSWDGCKRVLGSLDAKLHGGMSFNYPADAPAEDVTHDARHPGGAAWSTTLRVLGHDSSADPPANNAGAQSLQDGPFASRPTDIAVAWLRTAARLGRCRAV